MRACVCVCVFVAVFVVVCVVFEVSYGCTAVWHSDYKGLYRCDGQLHVYLSVFLFSVRKCCSSPEYISVCNSILLYECIVNI